MCGLEQLLALRGGADSLHSIDLRRLLFMVDAAGACEANAAQYCDFRLY